MKININRCAFLLVVLCLFVSIGYAQGKASTKQDCQNYKDSNGGKFSFSEAREMTMSAQNTINVDALSNGNISVRGENREDVSVHVCVQASANTPGAARELARAVRVETGSVIRADNTNGEDGWSVSYEILVPRSSNLKLSGVNGNINIASVKGEIELETVNGEIHLSEVAGSVKGRTVNRPIYIALSDNGWKGKRLNVETINGSINLTIPKTYAARIESNTINGSFQSDIVALKPNLKEKRHDGQFTAELNGGGALLRFMTINGNIVITSSANNIYFRKKIVRGRN